MTFMRRAGATRPPAAPAPRCRSHAKRRAALTALFPGDTLVIPSGSEQVRANDTISRFRAGSDFMYLTGDHDPD